MIESGRVVALEPDSVWVATEQKTACGGCSANGVCGQSLLSRLHPERQSQLKVALDGARQPALGETVAFSVPDHAILSASAKVYLLPLLLMLAAALLVAGFGPGEPLIMLAALLGLLAGGLINRWLELSKKATELLPVLVEKPFKTET